MLTIELWWLDLAHNTRSFTIAFVSLVDFQNARKMMSRLSSVAKMQDSKNLKLYYSDIWKVGAQLAAILAILFKIWSRSGYGLKTELYSFHNQTDFYHL